MIYSVSSYRNDKLLHTYRTLQIGKAYHHAFLVVAVPLYMINNSLIVNGLNKYFLRLLVTVWTVVSICHNVKSKAHGHLRCVIVSTCSVGCVIICR